MKNWDELASSEVLDKTTAALKKNGINTVVVDNGEEAKQKVLELIPEGAEVMNMSSETLRNTGIAAAVEESGKYDSVKAKLNKMDRATQGLEMQKLGAAPEWALGSVHAVTEDGVIFVASNTGSQLGAYSYGSAHVIWVVGTQKIVGNSEEAHQRIYDYILPLETKRLSAALGRDLQSNVSKLLIISKEVNPERATIIFVKEKLGF